MSLDTHGGRIVPILTGPQHPGAVDAAVECRGKTEPSEVESSLDNHEFTLNNALPEKHDYAPPFPPTSSSPNPQTMPQASLEMPSLRQRGLFALPTEGDGNCLYYSLSDQLYGNFDHDSKIREILADHMAINKDYFMQFVAAKGGERRRPKRSAPSTYATRSADVTAPSEDDMERQFDEMISLTRQNGKWGSSEHLQAFCQAYKLDINVYTMDGTQHFRDVNAGDAQRDVIHIAYHDFRHYSSVRVLNAEHKGLLSTLPHLDKSDTKKDSFIDIKTHSVDTEPTFSRHSSYDTYSRSCTSEESDTTLDTSYTAQGQPFTKENSLAVDISPSLDIQHIQNELGGRYDHDTIVDMLQRCRGDIDRAFAALLGENPDSEKKLSLGPTFKPSVRVSRSSSPYSTGSKRSADDSDEDSDGPRSAIGRGRPRKRLISNLTMGVGISFRDDRNEVVSLKLQMESEAAKANTKTVSESVGETKIEEKTLPKIKLSKAEFGKGVNSAKLEMDEKSQQEKPSYDSTAEQSESFTAKGPRRSGRLSKSRPSTPR